MSSTGTNNTSTAGEPKAPSTAETHQFSALADKGPASSNNPLEISRASTHSAEKVVNLSLPNPGEVAGEMMPGEAGIPDSITKAMLDALQVKRTVFVFLRAQSIPLGRIRAAQLKQSLLVGREPSDNIIHATLDHIYLE